MLRGLIFTLLLAGPALALTGAPMRGAEFRALAEGWTLHFVDEDGEYFGSEQYFPGGRTIWLPRGGTCEPGTWAARRGRICFSYAVGGACWRLYQDGDNEIVAETAESDNIPGFRIRMIRRDQSPLLCPDGPGV